LTEIALPYTFAKLAKHKKRQLIERHNIMALLDKPKAWAKALTDLFTKKAAPEAPKAETAPAAEAPAAAAVEKAPEAPKPAAPAAPAV
jgi:hypothetical protein